MGKILAKLEQLFTPGFLQPPPPSAASAASATPPQTSSAAASFSSDSDSEETFQCRQFMGSIIAKFRGGRKGWSTGSAPGASAGGMTVSPGGKGSPTRRRVLSGGGGGRGLPFDALPDVCKLRVFSFLDVRQRGCAAQVNSEWNDLIRSPSLWSDVDLTQIPSNLDPTHAPTNRGAASADCHSHRSPLRHRCGDAGCRGAECRGHAEGRDAYDARLAGYLARVSDINPPLQRLSFTYDIYSNHNRFLDALTDFLSSSRCAELRSARLVWDRFPDPSGADPPAGGHALSRLGPSHSEGGADADASDRQRTRQRHFVQFFQSFVSVAPNVSTLDLPFDWSTRSLESLARLPLRHLSLRPYFECRAVEPEALSRLLAGLVRLESLTLEAWTASGAGLVAYRLESDSLRKLDLAACRGFCFDAVRLPSAREMRVSRRPYCGPLGRGGGAGGGGEGGEARGRPAVLCLYEVLRDGAPALVRLNDHTLREDWREAGSYGELERVLKDACPCPLHHRGNDAAPLDDDAECCCGGGE